MNREQDGRDRRNVRTVEFIRDTPLAMDADSFRRAGHVLVDAMADSLSAIPDGPVTRAESPDEIRALLGSDRPLPDEGVEAGDLLRDSARMLFDHSLFNGHPRFFGYVTSSPAPIGMLGDLLAAALNPNVGAWRLSPVASEIEAQAVRWIAELTGYPVDCGGLMVSGGNVANAVGLAAARVAAADWDIRSEGACAASSRRMRVYASSETHTWLENATDLSGLGTDAIRWIPADRDLKMDTAALRQAIERDREAGELPIAVIGTAGTVGTGTIDPLLEIAEICREMGVWFHVDGAYGGFAAAVPGVSDDLRGLALADSVALDPHKWLYAPLEAGCALVRDAALLRNAYSYHPPYYHFGQEATDYHALGPQNSRGFRALKVWLGLRQAGRSGYVQMIGDDIRLSKRLYDLLDDHPEFDAITQSLSITTFQYVPEDLRRDEPSSDEIEYLNRLNEELLERIQTSGEAFVSNALVGDRYALRACIVNFNTTEGDIDLMPEIVARLGRDVDEHLRPGARTS